MVIAVIALAGVIFAGRWRTPNGHGTPNEDDHRNLHLAVAWSPTPRTKPIVIGYVINGIMTPIPDRYDSPWDTVVTIRQGDALILQAAQDTPGILSCAIRDARAKVIAHNQIDKPGVVECGAPAM